MDIFNKKKIKYLERIIELYSLKITDLQQQLDAKHPKIAVEHRLLTFGTKLPVQKPTGPLRRGKKENQGTIFGTRKGTTVKMAHDAIKKIKE